ncbi:hypothetical protein CC2G_011505 [Coprinopsis cinerea AmutBmut pab1-1]|nr:hypothetical protein CC2G_011505 [Coprinopsis cinerea AmutBmut pab1-1]
MWPTPFPGVGGSIRRASGCARPQPAASTVLAVGFERGGISRRHARMLLGATHRGKGARLGFAFSPVAALSSYRLYRIWIWSGLGNNVRRRLRNHHEQRRCSTS